MVILMNEQNQKIKVLGNPKKSEITHLNNGMIVKKQMVKSTYFIGTVVKGNEKFKKGDVVSVTYDEENKNADASEAILKLISEEGEKIYKHIIIAYRNKHRISQDQLTAKLKLPYNISKIESGEIEPDEETLKIIAEYFKCSLDYLHGRVEYPGLEIADLKDLDLDDKSIKIVVTKGHKVTQEEFDRLEEFIKNATDELDELKKLAIDEEE